MTTAREPRPDASDDEIEIEPSAAEAAELRREAELQLRQVETGFEG